MTYGPRAFRDPVFSLVQSAAETYERRKPHSDLYVRLSVGIEHIDDIIADLERALTAVGSLARAA